ncbi:hypothetical protein HMPREF1870_01843 [Bacteroidales bacterium KA00344]|nr:hypothetical protein HMPREF1870_01843 [Bacteroidales bacterium KA00344]
MQGRREESHGQRLRDVEAEESEKIVFALTGELGKFLEFGVRHE